MGRLNRIRGSPRILPKLASFPLFPFSDDERSFYSFVGRINHHELADLHQLLGTRKGFVGFRKTKGKGKKKNHMASQCPFLSPSSFPLSIAEVIRVPIQIHEK